MSFAAQSWAHEQLAGTGESGAKFVLAILGYRASKADLCWPSQQQLAEDTEQSVSTIARRLQDLEERGLVARIKRLRPDGSKTSDLIVVLRSDRARALAARLKAMEPVPAGSEFEEDDFDIGAFLATPTLQPDGYPTRQPDGSPSLQPEGCHPSQPEGRAPVTGEGSKESSLEPSVENPLAPKGAAGEVDEVLKRFGLTHVPTVEDFIQRSNPDKAASKKLIERQWKRYPHPLDRIRIFLTWRPYAQHCDDHERKRCDPQVFISRELWRQFEPQRDGAAAMIDTPYRREIRAIATRMRGPSYREDDWTFVEAGSPAWNEWQKAFRLADRPPLRPWRFQPTRFQKLQGGPEAEERTGLYFPQALPPTAGEADLLATVATRKPEPSRSAA